MVKKNIVAPGQTLFAMGTLGAGTELLVDAGTATQPGGVVEIRVHAANKSRVSLYGSTAPGVGAASATIRASGYLINQGTITFGAGEPTGYNSGIYGASASATVFGVLSNAGTINLSANANGAMLDLAAGGVLTNSGMINAHGGSDVNGSTGAGAGSTITVAGTLNCTAGGHVSLYGGRAPMAGTTATGAFMEVTGVLTNAAAGIVRVVGAEEGAQSSGIASGGSLDIAASGHFYNAGNLLVESTYSTLSPGFGSASGGGVLSVEGTLQNTGFVTVYAGHGETGSTEQGGTMVVTGLFTNYNSVIVAQGNDLSGPGGTGLGGVLLVAGTMVNDRLTYAQYAGLVAYGGGGSIDPAHLATGGTIGVSGTLDNVTGILLGAGYQARARAGYYGGQGAQLNDSGTILNQSTIYVALGVTGASATFDITGTLTQDGGSITGGGVVINNGTIDALHTASIGAIGGHGVIDVAAGATLTLTGAIAAGQSIALAAGATIELASPENFQGVFTNIAAGATIDLLDMRIPSAQLAAGALSLTPTGGAPVVLQLGAAPPGFSLVSDGHGGTDLMVQSPHS